MRLPVTEIQRFCMHDGDGVRTTVFFKGCSLRCEWCHNPETQKTEQEILYYKDKCVFCGGCVAVCPQGALSIGESHCFDRKKCTSCERCTEACPTGALVAAKRDMSLEDILSAVERDRAFYGEKGGVTLSGGEPLIHGDAVIELLKLCKERNISTAVETCGHIPTETLKKVIPYVDLFLWDIKDTDSERHKRYTGVSNERIIENLLLADSLGAKTVVRCIAVNGVNADREHAQRLAELWLKLSNCRYVELIPYHAYGGSKMLPLGKKDNGRREWIPSDCELEEMRHVLHSFGVKLK